MYHAPGDLCVIILETVQLQLKPYTQTAVLLSQVILTNSMQRTFAFNSPETLINFPTRGANTLDQIFTNLSEFYADVQRLPPFGLSDHLTIVMPPKVREKSEKSKVIKIRDKRPSKKSSVGQYISI